jgi:hypothetical protein
MPTPWMSCLVALATMILCGCGARFESTKAPAEAVHVIDPRGGTLTISEGPAKGAKLVIPAGALKSPVAIMMRTGAVPKDLPKGATAAGPAVTFGPDGQKFLKPVSLTLPAIRTANGIYTRPDRGGAWRELRPRPPRDACRCDALFNVLECRTGHPISCNRIPIGFPRSGARWRGSVSQFLPMHAQLYGHTDPGSRRYVPGFQ